MKRIFTFILALAIVCSLSACSSARLSEDYSEDAVISRAKEVVELINALDYSAVHAELRDDLQDTLTTEKLENALEEKIGDAGDFSEYSTVTTAGQKSKSTGEDYATVVLVCKYENAAITYVISMDKNMDIVGINLK